MEKKDGKKDSQVNLLARRKFLQQIGAGTATVAAMGASPRSRSAESPSPADIIDVAIVGAGVSGAYCAWRLMTDVARRNSENRIRRVHLFESSDRIGGRLLSIAPDGMPHLRAEFGGMRYLTNQKVVKGLVEELRLPYGDFQPPKKTHSFYLRGKHFFEDDLTRIPDRVPYQLSESERHKSIEALIESAIGKIIGLETDRDPKSLTAGEWLSIKQTRLFRGQNLYDTGFWNVLSQTLSLEAYNLIVDALGYFSVLGNWNAAEAMPWILADFDPRERYLKLLNGYHELPQELINRFRNAGGGLSLGYRLVAANPRFQYRGRRINCLTFRDRNSRTKSVYANTVILAMPKRAIEILLETNECHGGDNQVFVKIKENLNAVTAHPAFKLFLGYESPWWDSTWWHSNTDLPIRQVYYWGTEGGQQGADPGNRRSLVMASYNDDRAVSFWQALANSGDTCLEGCVRVAPRAMVQTALNQLEESHGLVRIPEPYLALYQDWTKDPYGGGWHFWNPKVKPWQVIPAIRRPDKDAQVFVCGEAYSSNQGWVEGALKSAERLLDDHFDLKRPDWLDPNYDLGP